MTDEAREQYIRDHAPLTDAEIRNLLTTTLHGPLHSSMMTRVYATLAEVARLRYDAQRVSFAAGQIPHHRTESELRIALVRSVDNERRLQERVAALEATAIDPQDLMKRLRVQAECKRCLGLGRVFGEVCDHTGGDHG